MNDQLKNIDPLDIEDLLIKVEKSFGIKFKENELSDVKTFGEMCDVITSKIELENSESCTTQQAFYKVRKSLFETLKIENVNPKTKLVVILPRKNRIINTKRLDETLGLKTEILRPKIIITSILLVIAISSFFGIFFYWKMGLFCFIFSILGFRIAKIYGKEFKIKNVGQLAEKITRENYIKSRRNPQTFNKNEIEKILMEWFSEELDIEKSELNRDATFI